MLRMFSFDVATFASARYFITETLVMPASRPMIVITTISSISVKPCIFLRFMTTASGWTSFREVPDLEDRQQDRDDDEPDDERKAHDEDRLDHRGDLLRRDLHLAVVRLCDALQHLLERSRLLADRDHVADDRREDARLL